MRKFARTILLLGCATFLTPVPAFGQGRKPAPVVARFGGECQGVTFSTSQQLKQLIQETKQQTVSPCNWPFCEGAFAYDLNGDRKDEFFFRLGCGATGNCTWGIFSDSPARLRGTFTAWFFYIHRRAGGWSALSTYTREGGDQGVIATHAKRRGKYLQTSERTERGYYGNPQPFLKRMGFPRCDVPGAAQPNNGMQRTRKSAALLSSMACARRS